MGWRTQRRKGGCCRRFSTGTSPRGIWAGCLPLATAASTRSRSPCSAGRWSVHPPVMSLTFDGTTSGERRTQSAHSLTLRKPRRDICRGAVHILHAHLRPHVRLVAAGMPRLPGRHSGERASASPRRSENACVAHLWIHYCEHHAPTAHTESSVAACKTFGVHAFNVWPPFWG